MPSELVRGLFLVASVSVVGCGAPDRAEADTSQPRPGDPDPEPSEPELTQEQLLDLYESAKTRVEAVTMISDESYASLSHDLRLVADKASESALRANASLLLGSVAEQRGDRRTAISFYRQATSLLPDEAATHAVLAVALAADAQWEDAIVSQWKVVEHVPDDLEAWLLLGEMQIKGSDPDAALTFTAYELRRKGLLDGLTLKQEGEYVLDEANRAACAEALAPAADNGTALALLYALDSDPAPKVRLALANVMGTQRLIGYQKLLETKLATEADKDVQAAMRWAIDEIIADGIETAPGMVPPELLKVVEEGVAKETVDVGLKGDPSDKPAEGAEGSPPTVPPAEPDKPAG